MTEQPFVPPTFPISIKGVVLDPQGRVLLLRNERQEWELPGGKLERADPPENPQQRLETEIYEESGWTATAGQLLDVWMYEPLPGRQVFIVTYGCTADAQRPPQVSHEHKEAALFHRDEVPGLVMPQGYKDSITRWYELLGRA